jgi:hypothetical protein
MVLIHQYTIDINLPRGLFILLLYYSMRITLLILLFLFPILIHGQIDEGFDNFNNTNEWISPGGNTGSHDGDLCFNITGNYLAGEFYVFQSPIYDFSTWSSVELLWSQESDIRNGDVFGLYFYDNGWFFYDISNLNGLFGVTLPNTTIALAFVLNTSGSGSLNGKYSHVDFLTIYDPEPLPVELLDFTGGLNEEGVLLEWSTASEFNSDYFALYKSNDGTSWNLLDQINAAGYSTSLIPYKYLDTDPLYNYSYYMLEQVDMDGSIESFDPICIFRNPKPDLDFYNIMGQKVNKFEKGLIISRKNGLMFRE